MTQAQAVLLKLSEIELTADDLRKRIDPARLKELAASIKLSGVLEPILVAKGGKAYVVVAGGRRYRAAKQAGLTSIPAIIRTDTPAELAIIRLVENLQREDLNVVEKAEGYAAYMERAKATAKQLSKRLGITEGHVSQVLAVRRLPKRARELLAAGKLNLSHARELNRIKDPRKLERMVRAMDKKLAAGAPAPRESDLRKKIDRALAKPRRTGKGVSTVKTRAAGEKRRGRQPGLPRTVSGAARKLAGMVDAAFLKLAGGKNVADGAVVPAAAWSYARTILKAG